MSRSPQALRDPSLGLYYRDAPQQQGPGWRRWITRSANFAIVYTEAEAGAKISGAFGEEHFGLTLAGGLIEAGGHRVPLDPDGLAVVPPGTWTFTAGSAGSYLQIVTAAEQVVEAAPNHATYAGGADEVAPPGDGCEPIGGPRLRTYSLPEAYARGGLVHAFRTAKLMIVPYPRFTEPRDETDLSPHAHEDFEQGSVALEGDWLHHLRFPWGTNRRQWREDRHLEVAAPSTLIVPAGVIHTSQNLPGAGQRLADVFSPPRADFIAKGWVDNAHEYAVPEPAPETASEPLA